MLVFFMCVYFYVLLLA